MTQETPPVVTPEARAIEKLELAVQLREARINALRRERMEVLFPRVEALEEEVNALREQVVKLTGQRDVLLETLRQTAQQLEQVNGVVTAVISAYP